MLAAMAFLLASAGSAAAASGTGSGGQRLTASPTTGLAPGGATVKVKGSGYDVSKGIYVAFCFDQGPGKVPTPCMGGVDTSGETGASAWVSSNPPAYGKDLAKPYTAGGGFTVSIKVAAKDPVMGFDCRNPAAHTETASAKGCAIVTRADHTRTSDRSADVRIPVKFSGSASPNKGTGAKAPNSKVRAGGGGSAPEAPDAPATPDAPGAPAKGGVDVAAPPQAPAPVVGKGPASNGTAEPIPGPSLAAGQVNPEGTSLAALPISAQTTAVTQFRSFIAVSAAAGLLMVAAVVRRRRRNRD